MRTVRSRNHLQRPGKQANKKLLLFEVPKNHILASRDRIVTSKRTATQKFEIHDGCSCELCELCHAQTCTSPSTGRPCNHLYYHLQFGFPCWQAATCVLPSHSSASCAGGETGPLTWLTCVYVGSLKVCTTLLNCCHVQLQGGSF